MRSSHTSLTRFDDAEELVEESGVGFCDLVCDLLLDREVLLNQVEDLGGAVVEKGSDLSPIIFAG